jgi:hypothetical protein
MKKHIKYHELFTKKIYHQNENSGMISLAELDTFRADLVEYKLKGTILKPGELLLDFSVSDINYTEITVYHPQEETDGEFEARQLRMKEAAKLVEKVKFQQYLKLKEQFENKVLPIDYNPSDVKI